MREERLSILTALDAALADPGRLVGILAESVDDADALRRLALAYDVDKVRARAIMDLQVGRLTLADRARMAEELRVLRADWGPPILGRALFTSRRSAVLSLDGVDHPIRGAGGRDALDQIYTIAVEQVAIPRLRPVVITLTGLPGGPNRLTVTPARGGTYDYPDDPIGREEAG